MNRKQRRKLISAINSAASMPRVGNQGLKFSRNESGLTISAETPTEPDNTINATWDADFTIVAESPVAPAPATDPNPATKLDNPDSQGGKMSPGQLPGSGTMKPDKSGNPPAPRFNISAYNGGPMKLNGYRNPVIVDGTGMKAAGTNIPIYAGHCQPYASPADQAEQLMGQSDAFNVDQATGKLGVAGPITAEPGNSETVDKLMGHAKNGFKFQASLNAQPSKLEFLPENVSAQVNGRTVMGPMVIARACVCDHIAIVPLGADTSTTTNIAAQAAKGPIMEFAAWLTATYLLDAATLTAAQKTKFEAEFARISASGGATGGTAGNGNGGTTSTAATAATAVVPPPVTATAGVGGVAADPIATMIAAQNKASSDNMERLGKIEMAAKGHPTIAAQSVRENWTVDKTELEVLRAERKAMETGTGNAPNIIASGNMIPKDGLGRIAAIPADRGGRHMAATGARVNDDVAVIAEVAGLISAGYSADKLAKNKSYGERAVTIAETEVRRRGFSMHLGPAGLIRLAASFAGIQVPHSNSDPEFLRTIEAEFSTMSLPTILSNLMNKFLLDSYTAVDPDYADPERGTAWQKFTKRGPVNDFKPQYRLRLTGDMTMQELSPTGEIQHGKLGEQSYTIQAKTRAIMLGITRRQIVDDDLSAMSTIPMHFGRGAGVTIAKFIYALIIANLESNGTTPFFRTSDVTTPGALMVKTLLTGAGLAFDTLQAAAMQMAIQTDPDGLPAGADPAMLLVPPQIVGIALQLYGSENIPTLVTALSKSTSTGGAVNQSNTLKGLYRPVCSAYLSQLAGGSPSTWFLTTSPANPVTFIEAGFLNGQEMPIVERAEADFNRLGISFRGYIDFGGNLAEPRAAVKNTA